MAVDFPPDDNHILALHQQAEPIISVSQEPSLERKTRAKLLWHVEVKNMYQGSETQRLYVQYNEAFQAWFNETHGAKK